MRGHRPLTKRITMKEHHLTILKGGLVSKEDSRKAFVSAYVTDSRLTGEIAMHIHWHVLDCSEASNLYQFFSFRITEPYIADYAGFWHDDLEDIQDFESSLLGDKAAKKMDISEKEARRLFQQYHDLARKNNCSLPPEKGEFLFLTHPRENPTPEEVAFLLSKQCGEIPSDHALIHYFFKALFGKDKEILSLLAREDLIKTPSAHDAGVLIKNTIQGQGPDYSCTSLLQGPIKSQLIQSQITLKNGQVISREIISTLPLTEAEYHMQTKRTEFLTLYTLTPGKQGPLVNDFFINDATYLGENIDGHFFFVYHKSRHYLDLPVYWDSSAILGSYYISPQRELLLTAGSLQDIHTLEQLMKKSPLGQYLTLNRRYEFPNPVLHDFIDSGEESLKDYLDYFTEE